MFSKTAAVAVLLSLTALPLYGGTIVSISGARGVYSVTARFSVAAPPEKVREVLTDYESIPAYSSSVVKSEIKSRKNSNVILEQVGSQRILPIYSVNVHLLLTVEETEDGIEFEDISGRDFRIYRGRWKIAAIQGGSEVEYFLTAQPAFYVPGFIANMIFVGKAKEICRELINEIDRRSAPLSLRYRRERFPKP
ncbi:MAG: SRPBCC family protein [Endomicrobiia bacterium]|nr:SRPBCC family protein [Endomicrobiia bacterium]